jgi:hypothetical protein
MSYICDVPKKFCNLRKEDGLCRLERPCLPVVEQCEGCKKIENGYCTSYIAPVIKWSGEKNCPLSTNIKLEYNKDKVRIGQQKGKKYR